MVSQSYDPLDRPHARRYTIRHGRRNHLYGFDQLPFRRVRHPYRLRTRLCSHHAQRTRRPLAPSGAAHVQQARSKLGVKPVGVRDVGDGGSTVFITQIRQGVEAEK